MPKTSELDRRVLSAMSGRERARYLLKEAGCDSWRDFAIEIGRYVEEVSMCMSGRREYPEIRDALAARIGVSRAHLDEMIGEAAA